MVTLIAAIVTENGTQFVLIGDFTGHGLAAALGTPTVADIFYTMVFKNFSMKDIQFEVNKKLCNSTHTGIFMAATYIEINPERTLLNIWNCGLPPTLIYKDKSLHRKIKSTQSPQGIPEIQKDKNEGTQIPLEPGLRLFAGTDGLIESRGTDGTLFGEESLETLLTKILLEESDLSLIEKALQAFTGSQATPEDDITLIEITI